MTGRISLANRKLLVVMLALLILGISAFFLVLRQEAKRPNVLLITLDSCRYDHLGCYGYQRAHTPNIDALARQGVAFSQAVSQASCTRFSVPSMATGRYPLFAQARGLATQLDESQITLAEVLKAGGYRTWVITQESPVMAAARGFEQIEDTAGPTLMRTRSCLQALQDLQDQTFFIWLYYWDPHAPYRPPPHFMELFEPEFAHQTGSSKEKVPRKSPRKPPGDPTGDDFIERRRKALLEAEKELQFRDETGHLKGELAVLGKINFQGDLVPTEADRQHLINLYDAEIAFVDGEIEKVVAKLQQLDLWDRALVLITADHGEAFGEHAKYYHGLNLYDEVIRVPLIIKPPCSRTQGELIEAQVRNVDIMPTVLDYCRVPIPGNIDGISLLPAMEGKPLQDRPAYMETFFQKRGSVEHLLLGYRTVSHKLIYDIIQGSSELFDLQADPGEKSNLLQTPLGQGVREPTRSLEGQIREALLEHLGVESLKDLAQRKLAQKMDQATQERLRALGYIE